MNPTRRLKQSLLVFLLIGTTAPALAAVPLASRQADRQAKFAVPSASEAFIYVYREDTSQLPLTVVLNGRDTARLDPRTFAMWRVRPGRAELTAEGTSSVLAIQTQGGHVYYAELSRSAGGIPILRQVSFPVGRTSIHRARLVVQGGARPRASAAAAPRYRSQDFALMFKPGSFKLANSSQTILGAQRAFDDGSSVAAIEGEWFIRPDISLGLEFTKYSNDYSTPGANATGSTDTNAVLVNAKRYFMPASAWQPYLGAGLGSAKVDFSGVIFGSTSGFALQLVGGVQWRREHLALRAEYKYLKADTEDNSGQKVDMSGSGLFLGLGFYF